MWECIPFRLVTGIDFVCPHCACIGMRKNVHGHANHKMPIDVMQCSIYSGGKQVGCAQKSPGSFSFSTSNHMEG